ncbi:hypothetical protein [Antarcticirhabdus aurantiaca]|uniref:Uncharacterized protein n=1 Tax=Antarcticirhabdus aurantiaca TaxID=2606717 RepID=A0ACD4NM43_9HYPH|nr:hypothetical protein [Antarcticirhabdus aurantiaca]WAJ27770.1 hypothetical protein OXU80_23470 [Jeongeuplla avenae]
MMRPLRDLLAGLRLILAVLALAGWVGPAAAMSRGMAVETPHAAPAGHHHDGGGEHHGQARAGHDATACCAAACGPVVAPQPGGAPDAAVPLAMRLRPALDAFPPGVVPATAKPPPRTTSL